MELEKLNIFNNANKKSKSELILYHGSDKEIKEPSYGIGKSDCDYGSGFYCTRDYNLAGEWSTQGKRCGIINKYKIDISDLDILYLNSHSYEDIMKWLFILLDNRRLYAPNLSRNLKAFKSYLNDNYSFKYNHYDMIVGFRADDSFFTIVRAFLSNIITVEDLNLSLHLGDLGLQYVLLSKKSFTKIRFIESYKSTEIHMSNYKNRDTKARYNFSNLESSGNTYLLDILRKGGYLK